MNSIGVRAALAVLLLFITTVKADDGGVTFWREDFTMTCPDDGQWFDKNKKEIIDLTQNKSYTVKYENSKKGLYYCEYGETKYYFYVQGKVCANCFELDAQLFMLATIVDVVGTASVMLIIYRCTKKKSSAGLTHASKPPARSGGRPPQVPSPDYEPLTRHTVSQDTYSALNRMG